MTWIACPQLTLNSRKVWFFINSPLGRKIYSNGPLGHDLYGTGSTSLCRWGDSVGSRQGPWLTKFALANHCESDSQMIPFYLRHWIDNFIDESSNCENLIHRFRTFKANSRSTCFHNVQFNNKIPDILSLTCYFEQTCLSTSVNIVKWFWFLYFSFIHLRIYHICRVFNYSLVNMAIIVNCLYAQFYYGRSILKSWSPQF